MFIGRGRIDQEARRKQGTLKRTDMLALGSVQHDACLDERMERWEEIDSGQKYER